MKIICFSNQKGGCGKSSLLTLFAAYLVKRCNINVSVIDADKQRTLASFYEKECVQTDNNPLYQVYSMPLEELSKMLANIDKNKDVVFLIDTPNQLNTENFFLVKYADHIIIPYNMSDSSILSTTTFLDVYKEIFKDDSKLIFLPNSIKTTTKKEKLDEFIEYLSRDLEKGVCTKNYIKDTIDIQRIGSLNINDSVLDKLKEPLSELATYVGLTNNNSNG